MNNGQAKLINLLVAGGLPTELKLFWHARDCGRTVVWANETAVDCSAIKRGERNVGFNPRHLTR